MLNIGFDISQTGATKAGCGYFAHALATALSQSDRQNYSFLPSFGDFYFDPTMPLGNPYPGPTSNYGARHLTRESARHYWAGTDIAAAVSDLDILHSNNFWCPAHPVAPRLVYTLYDLGFLIDPSWTTEANRLGCFDGVFRAAANADWVLAISEASRQHFLDTFPSFPSERTSVIYPCSRFVDVDAVGARPARLENMEEGGFWLSVGTIEPRKNQTRLLEAYRDYLAQSDRKLPLVLAGGKGWLMEDFQSRIAALGLEHDVLFTGYVSDEELIWLYRNCYANLYPSLFEGFGLPVLEGMQFGAATLSSSSTSLPEVAGDATIQIDPHDTAGWTAAMLRLAADPDLRSHLKAASLARAATFDWRASADALMQLYHQVLDTPKRAPIR